MICLYVGKNRPHLEIGVKSFGQDFRDFVRTIPIVDCHNPFVDIKCVKKVTGSQNMTFLMIFLTSEIGHSFLYPCALFIRDLDFLGNW